jgi:phospholipid/cholesterol/gamma-HCH transport system permease protein
MNDSSGWLQIKAEKKIARVSAGGDWTIEHLAELYTKSSATAFNHVDRAVLNFTRVEKIDTAGAQLVRQLLENAQAQTRVEFSANKRVDSILNALNRYQATPCCERPETNFFFEKITALGRGALHAIDLTACFVIFIGVISASLFTLLIRPQQFRTKLTARQIELSGLNAIPIIILIAFLIGIVVAYQGAWQLGKLGADVYTVDLLAVTILRELGILLTAIVIAGRSGSTYAAEIGSMKISQEIDAMQTIGLNPIEILVIPRVVGLVIALPILTLLANIFGIMGGGILVWAILDISPRLFLGQLLDAVSPWTYWVGIMKAPVFAAIIAVIGCYEGMQVSGSAESLGKHTTRAVVEAIFLIIVFDALFSIFFGILGI